MWNSCQRTLASGNQENHFPRYPKSYDIQKPALNKHRCSSAITTELNSYTIKYDQDRSDTTN